MLVEYINLTVKKTYEPSVVGLGYFDGVHLGHQKLINEVKNIAKQRHVKSAIFTFDKSIDVVLNKPFVGEITPLKQRIKEFEKLDLDICYVFEFNKEIASLSPEDFINKILKPLNLSCIVCGKDFHYGKFGAGDSDLLKKHFDVNVIDFRLFDDIKISSSGIIPLIKQGDVVLAREQLGRPFYIEGKVVKGLGNGKKIGFPTANVDYTGFALPLNGVYQVKVKVNNKEYDGVANIGCHPSIDELNKEALEVYIIDFNEDIYDEIIKVEFIKYLRKEEKFTSIDELINNIHHDAYEK